MRGTVGHIDGAGVISLRLLGEQPDRSTQAVLAEQSSLRTAQHFDAIQVQQVHVGAGQCAVVDIIDIDADARIGRVDEVRSVDAAHADGCVGSVAGVRLHEIRIRDDAAQLLHVADALLLEALALHGCDRDRRVLQVLLAVLGGHDDLLQLPVVGGGGLRRLLCERCGSPQRAEHRHGDQPGPGRTRPTIDHQRAPDRRRYKRVHRNTPSFALRDAAKAASALLES